MKKIFSIIYICIVLLISLYFIEFFLKSDNKDTSANLDSEQISSIPEPTIKEPETVKFIAAGDNLIHGSIYLQAAKRANGNGYDFKYPYENIKYYFDDFDVKFINQETLINDAFKPSTYPQFSTPIEMGQQVIDMGFNAIGISNNHSYDKGEEGILSSLDYWSKQDGIEYFGFYTGDDDKDIKYMDVNGIKIAFLAYTSYTNGLSIYDPNCPYIILTNDYETIERQVKRAKEDADIVIVSCHWGVEETNNTIPQQEEIAKKLNEFGVDAIIGTHPHVIQPVEWIENPENGHKTIVCYSLGNFISAQSSANTMLGGLFQFDIVKTYTDINDNYIIEIKEPKFVPTVTHYDYDYSNIRNYLLKDYTDELSSNHGVRERQSNFSIEFMESIVNQYIQEEFLLYK